MENQIFYLTIFGNGKYKSKTDKNNSIN